MARSGYLEVDPKYSSVFNLVDPEREEFEEDVFSSLSENVFNPPSESVKAITLTEGFCVKAKTNENEKLFLNVCHSPDIPPPPESLNVYEIIAGGKSDEEALFRFPLSLGEPHLEKDKSGNECKCYDVVLNNDYYKEVSNNPVLRDFIMTLACSELERKYDLSIDVGTCVMLNKPYHGKIPPHYIRVKPDTKSKQSPLEQIVAEPDIMMPVKDSSRLKVFPVPDMLNHRLYKIPTTGNPSLLVFQGLTAAVERKSSLRVIVSKRKLTIRHTNGRIFANLALPYAVIPNKSLSNFCKSRLTVAMYVESFDSE